MEKDIHDRKLEMVNVEVDQIRKKLIDMLEDAKEKLRVCKNEEIRVELLNRLKNDTNKVMEERIELIKELLEDMDNN